MEEAAAALSLRVQADTLRLQQMQAQLGVVPPPQTAEEPQCVVCMDAPKDHIVLPCLHVRGVRAAPPSSDGPRAARCAVGPSSASGRCSREPA